MKKLKVAVVGSIIILQSVVMAFARQRSMTDMVTAQQKLGYALGMEMGESLKKMHPDIELNALLAGLADTYDGRRLRMSRKEAKAVKDKFLQKRLKQNKISQGSNRLISAEIKKSMSEKVVETPANSLSLGMINQATISKAAWSFVILYNDIMPVFTEKRVDKICRIMAAPEFMNGCKQLLHKRLEFLKKNIKVIKKAVFTNPKLVKNSNGNDISLSWDETFTFPGGKQTINRKKLNLRLTKIKKWRISSANLLTVRQGD